MRTHLDRRALRVAAVSLLGLSVAVGSVASATDESTTPEDTESATTEAADGTAAPMEFSTINDGVLTIGSQQSYIPGEFFEEGSDELQGFGVDIIEEIASRLGLETRWVQIDYSAIITGLQSNQFDMGSGGMSVNPERLEQVDMVGYFQSGATFIVRKEDEGTYADAQDLCGQTIGMLEGSSTLEAAVATENEECGDEPIEIEYYTTTPLGLQGLLSGRITAYTPDLAQTQFIVSQFPDDFADTAGYTLVSYLINFTFVKDGNTELRDAVFSTLAVIMEDGTYGEILDEWGIESGRLDEPAYNGEVGASPLDTRVESTAATETTAVETTS